MPTPNFGLPTYDTMDTAALDTLLNGQSSAIDAALTANITNFIGTDAERLAMTAPLLREGITVQTTDTDRRWYYDGSNWITNDNGLYIVQPATAFGSGATLAADGSIELGAVGAGVFVGANGVFSSRFKRFLVNYEMRSGTAFSVNMRFLAGGAQVAGLGYTWNVGWISGGAASGASNSNQNVATVSSQNNTLQRGALEFTNVGGGSAQPEWQGLSTFGAVTALVGGVYNIATNIDGIALAPQAAITGGRIRIFGYA